MADPVYDNIMADRRAETAAFIVSVYNVYMREIAAGNPPGTTSAQLPNAPAHVSSVLHAECLDVARVLAQAASNVREYLASRHFTSIIESLPRYVDLGRRALRCISPESYRGHRRVRERIASAVPAPRTSGCGHRRHQTVAGNSRPLCLLRPCWTTDLLESSGSHV